MTTIKELYDKGQRQFPMRGGGISPPIEYDDENECFWNDGFKWFSPCGNVQMHDDDNDSFDLLPQPLPDTTAKLEALVAAWNALEWEVKEIGKLDDPNLFAIIHNAEALIALHDAFVEAAGGVK